MRVLISGGGIAGPALAFWLHRYGIEATVVERASGPRPGGQAVDVRGAAREVVHRMGLMPQVRAATVDERGIATVDAAGRWTSRMPADAFGGEGFVAEIELPRGELARVLYEATRDHVDYRFGERVTALHSHGRGVRVELSGGGAEDVDLVVGADGVHSGVRALAFGPEDSFVRPLGGYIAWFSVPDPGDLRHWYLMYNAPGGLAAGLRPESGGTAKAYLSFTSAEPGLERLPVHEQQRLLADRLSGAGWRVPALLAAMPTAPDFVFDSLSRVSVERWSRGRVVLLGDAGYCGSPLAGLGTSLALVGAYVLAGELATAGDDVEAACAAYQDRLRDYVEAGTQLPPGGIGGYAPQTATMIRLRALSMRMMLHWPMKQVLAGQFAKAGAFDLPDYATALRAR
ncbi:FAD-dependent monooxygenase [Dactylosporangium aurantiacum]|uniref:FAD-dependent monooxygenase n=1 Tax=Dactylosporangium aurantiacum TaxID=35754 RepID=A0A9Q9IK01_9ACTN|nr:FAD-dependent monooxygenase [Dactylosporangium aurantiacum]MDG6103045.1 FAD-dependent monooxygenase [Dactylosporangium aurantiacum]UWZ57557.1 FAD-dependent monooxygenase [Dactylosporangium aurantiacum]